MSDQTIAVANRAASIKVVASLDGRPLRIEIDPSEYAHGAAGLAARVLELCQLAGSEALAARRAELAASGFEQNMLARLGLPTRAELSERELTAEMAEDGEPQSWLARV